MHDIANVANTIIDWIDIIPTENIVKKSIIDKNENAPSPYVKNTGKNKNTNVIIADITWLSVKLEIRTPNDIYDDDNNKNPIIVINSNLKFICPYCKNNKQSINDNAMDITTTINTAVIFPNTTVMVFFLVANSKFSVSLLFSSENDFIVSTAITIGKPYQARLLYAMLKSILWLFIACKYIAPLKINKKIATTTYPTGE